MPAFAIAVFFVMTMAGIAISQFAGQSILHHIDVVALSNREHGSGRARCSSAASDATRSTVYNAGACEGHRDPMIWNMRPHNPDVDIAEFTNTSSVP